MLSFLADNADALQTLAAVVSVATVVPAAVIFFLNQREEQLERKEAKYLELDTEYREFLRLAFEHPKLGLYQSETMPPSRSLTPPERHQKIIAFDMLSCLFERAFVLHATAPSSFRREQWEGWAAFIDAYTRREDYLEFWREVMGGGDWNRALAPGASQYDRRFEAFICNRIKASLDLRSGASQRP